MFIEISAEVLPEPDRLGPGQLRSWRGRSWRGRSSEWSVQRSYNKSIGVGTDAFHPRALLYFSDETCQTVADFLRVVEVIGMGLAAASCIMLFLSPMTVDNCSSTCKQAIEHVQLKVRWSWECTSNSQPHHYVYCAAISHTREGCFSRAVHTYTAILPGRKSSVA